MAGRADFLYVADSKLCSRENMDHIDRAGGRFVTVLPRNRSEDEDFRKWIQTNTPEWTLVWDRPHPRYADGPRDRWFVYRPLLPSAEGWTLVWVRSTLLTLRQEARRKSNMAAASEELTELPQRLAGPRTRLRGAADNGVGATEFAVDAVLPCAVAYAISSRGVCATGTKAFSRYPSIE